MARIQSQMCSQSLWCWDRAHWPREMSPDLPRIPDWILARGHHCWGRTCCSLWIHSIIKEAGLTEFTAQIPALNLALNTIPRFLWTCFGKPGRCSMAKARAPSPQWSGTWILAGFVRKTWRSQYNAQFPAGRDPARQENISTFPEALSSASLLPAAFRAGRINFCWNCSAVNPHLGSSPWMHQSLSKPRG